MKHWIAVASAEHVRLGRAAGFMQVSHGKAAPLRRIAAGDLVAYYSPTVVFGDKDAFRSFTAIGKVLLSALSKEDLDAYLRRGPYEAYTPKTITSPAALREEIKRVAASGMAYDDAEFNHELRCIAAPVRNFTQQTIAAFGISGPVWRVTQKDMQRLGARVACLPR